MMLRTVIQTLLIGASAVGAQETPAERGVQMALEGRCQEALPLLKQAQQEVRDKDLKRKVGKGGVRCSMLLNQENDATSFLAWLQHEFPHDPEILFMAVHVYSDLARINSDALMNAAPNSPEVIQLNAENFEKQGNWKQAIAEYRILLQRSPETPGIHYRIGGILMAQPATATSAAQARKEFEAELKIFPQNAGAEYYLGELARQQDKLPDAIQHYSRATQFSPRFAEAYFGLGRSLLDSGRAWDSLTPLKTSAELQPENPNVHFALATAYQRLGKTEEAAREFALQKSTAEKLNQNTKTIRKNISGAQQ
jgi:tetratricopeptide (TPR) repeat protein